MQILHDLRVRQNESVEDYSFRLGRAALRLGGIALIAIGLVAAFYATHAYLLPLFQEPKLIRGEWLELPRTGVVVVYSVYLLAELCTFRTIGMIWLDFCRGMGW